MASANLKPQAISMGEKVNENNRRLSGLNLIQAKGLSTEDSVKSTHGSLI